MRSYGQFVTEEKRRRTIKNSVCRGEKERKEGTKEERMKGVKRRWIELWDTYFDEYVSLDIHRGWKGGGRREGGD